VCVVEWGGWSGKYGRLMNIPEENDLKIKNGFLTEKKSTTFALLLA